jgi:hypothetical protein
MKKMLTLALLASALGPMAANAATSREELRRDRQDIREEQRDFQNARRYGSRSDVRDEREDYADARREYREDLRDFRRDRGRHYAHGRNHNDRWGPAVSHRNLPRAYGPFRWVNYRGDALLVDTRNGDIRRVIRGFRW